MSIGARRDGVCGFGARQANAFGFPPRALDRHTRQEDKALLERKEINNLPQEWSGWLWYTDGGTIDNEPLGFTFGITNDIDADGRGRRLHLLIHPTRRLCLPTRSGRSPRNVPSGWPRWPDPTSSNRPIASTTTSGTPRRRTLTFCGSSSSTTWSFPYFGSATTPGPRSSGPCCRQSPSRRPP